MTGGAPFGVVALAVAALTVASPPPANAQERRVTELPRFGFDVDLGDDQSAWVELSGDLYTDGAPGAQIVGVGGLADLSGLVPAAETTLARTWIDDRCGDVLTILDARLSGSEATLRMVADVDYRRWACVDVFGQEIRQRLARVRGRVFGSVQARIDADGVRFDGGVDAVDLDYELAESGALTSALFDALALAETDVDALVIDVLERELTGALRDLEDELRFPEAFATVPFLRREVTLDIGDDASQTAVLILEAPFDPAFLHALVGAIIGE